MNESAGRIRFRDAYSLVKDTNELHRGAKFADELQARTRAIGEAFVEENGWTSSEVARMFDDPERILDIPLGAHSLAKFEEFTAWLAENVSFSLEA
jgi:hypothetical protein